MWFFNLFRFSECQAGVWLAHSRCSLNVWCLQEQLLKKMDQTAKEWKEKERKIPLPSAHPAWTNLDINPGWENAHRACWPLEYTKVLLLLLPHPKIKAKKKKSRINPLSKMSSPQTTSPARPWLRAHLVVRTESHQSHCLMGLVQWWELMGTHSSAQGWECDHNEDEGALGVSWRLGNNTTKLKSFFSRSPAQRKEYLFMLLLF